MKRFEYMARAPRDMADTKDRPDLISFNLESMAALHGAVAMTRSLPLMSDLALQDRVLICTVVSELGTNILKFAGKGTVSVARVVDNGHDAIQVVAQDNGPGIRDLELAMQDGYSTSETLGLGLPAVRRIMSTMNVETGAGRGTRVVASKWLDNFSASDRQRSYGQWPRTEQRRLMDVEYSQKVRPYPGESVSGDVAVLRALDSGLLFGIIDGSGHGLEAHRVAQRLSQVVAEEQSSSPQDLLRTLHRHAAGTRGAAVGLACLDCASRRLTYAGIGNVHIRVLGARSWRGVSRDGIVGERMPGILPQAVGVLEGDVIVVASDGVSESSRSTALLRGSALPAREIAEKVILEAGKATDDASCVVVRCL
jgi:anti-sigma regulatory factor (Ser/Thr protein kinase)